MPWQREGSGMFESRVMETEFLNRPDGDSALSPPATGLVIPQRLRCPGLVAGGYDFILISVPDKRSLTVIRSGRITVVGRSNAGKSALFNPR